MPSPIRPPFTEKTARAKVKTAQDTMNTRDAQVQNGIVYSFSSSR